MNVIPVRSTDVLPNANKGNPEPYASAIEKRRDVDVPYVVRPGNARAHQKGARVAVSLAQLAHAATFVRDNVQS